MAQCQIYIAQTALVHHLLSEIRISYLYTWYTHIHFLYEQDNNPVLDSPFCMSLEVSWLSPRRNISDHVFRLPFFPLKVIWSMNVHQMDGSSSQRPWLATHTHTHVHIKTRDQRCVKVNLLWQGRTGRSAVEVSYHQLLPTCGRKRLRKVGEKGERTQRSAVIRNTVAFAGALTADEDEDLFM